MSVPAAALSSSGFQLTARQAVRWHVLMALCPFLVLLGLEATAGGALRADIAAALVLCWLPGLASLALFWRDGHRERLALLAFWALSGSAAVALLGGLAGPLSGWCAAPLAASIALDQRKLMSAGAALSLATITLTFLAGLFGDVRIASHEALWLGLIGVGAPLAGAAVALLPSLRLRALRAEGAEDVAARLEYLLGQQPNLILTLDAEGVAHAAYGAAPIGMPAETLLSQGLIPMAFAPDRPLIQAALRRAFERGAAEIEFRPHAALDRHCGLSLRIAGSDRLIGVLRDASLQHAREAALESAKHEAEAQNAKKSRFLAQMSHELRTPLNAVIGFSDLMRHRLFGPMEDKYGEYAQSIWESGNHLLDLISDILDMSKIEADRYELNLETFDLREAASASLRLVRVQADEAGLNLSGVMPTDPIWVEADRRALKQMMLNLAANAVKFTPEGGKVVLTVLETPGAVEIIVSDTGVGISPEDLTRIGRPFEQAGDPEKRAQGTGLGLALVRALAGLHGGDLILESAVGAGTSAHLRLPILTQAPAPELF